MCELIRGEGGGGRGVVHLDVEVEENECFVNSLLVAIVYCNICIAFLLPTGTDLHEWRPMG